MHRMTQTAALCAALAGVLALGGCGKHEAATPVTPPAKTHTARAATAAAPPARNRTVLSPAAAASTAGPAAATSAPFAIARLSLGHAVDANHRISESANRFTADEKTLYASVATTGRSSEVSLTAQWHYLEGRGRLISEISQSIATDGPAVTTFQLHNPDLWPEGRYRVDISIDGKPATGQDFEITKSR